MDSECAWCGDKIIKPDKNDDRFCSAECYQNYFESSMTKQHESKLKNIETHICEICGTAHNNKYNFCSSRCSITFCENHNMFCQMVEITHKCAYCGGLCQLNIKFCGPKCFGKYYSGEKSPGWKGGISHLPYCKKFNHGFKERVRAYFEYKCFICGKHENELTKALHIHHVEQDKQTCCNDRLHLFVPLCGRCHGLAHHCQDWEKTFKNRLKKQYKNKCYYTKEEFSYLVNEGKIKI